MASFLQDGLVLLRTAYSLPISHFHPVTTSVSEFIALLTACITSLSQFPPVQATACFSDLNELLTNYPLLPNLRQALDSLMLTLSVTFGDDLKVIQHTQIPHAPLPTSSGSKADVFGPSSDTDIISLGLLLNHLVTTTLSSLATRPFVLFVFSRFKTKVLIDHLYRLQIVRMNMGQATKRMLWRCS